MAISTVVDISDRSFRMPADSSILYPARNQAGDDPPSHGGIIRVSAPGLFWVKAWPRTVNGKNVIEVRLSPKG